MCLYHGGTENTEMEGWGNGMEERWNLNENGANTAVYRLTLMKLS
jgi:hypothetical protein